MKKLHILILVLVFVGLVGVVSAGPIGDQGGRPLSTTLTF